MHIKIKRNRNGYVPAGAKPAGGGAGCGAGCWGFTGYGGLTTGGCGGPGTW